MSKEDTVEMFVGGLVLDPNTQAPVVVLKDESGEIVLPIWIGVAEATSIASAIKQLTMARPLTHDLMFDVFDQIGVKIQQVVITELKESTYHAELALSFGDRAILLDARPSDSIALALRAAAPIYVTREVLDQARIAFSAAQGAATEEGEGAAQEETGDKSDTSAEEQPPGQDFASIDKDKWDELLKELDPDDFKYKM